MALLEKANEKMRIGEPTICLNMIVKNESKIITRLLDSVASILDTYCICDTGSTDDTISLIENYFNERNIKGKIIEHAFVNFEVNRNIALKAANNMADYVLLMDADMQLQIAPEFSKSQLTDDVYTILQDSNLSYYNVRLLSTKLDAEYAGVTHECINIKNPSHKSAKLHTLKIKDIGDGGCKSDKFKRDIELLSKELEETPNNIRSNFYLANSYFDAGDFTNALKYYQAHAKIVNWNEEEFYNYFKQGSCYKHLGDHEKMASSWIKAWTVRPNRVESLYELIHYYRCNSMWNYCKLYYETASRVVYPTNDVLFVHKDVYNYKLLYEYTVFGYYVGERTLYKELAHIMSIPNSVDLNNLFNNYKFYYPQLKAEKSIQIQDSFSRQINNVSHNFRSSTPSIIKYKNNYAMNLRFVNYNIQPNGRYDWVKNIISINKFIVLNANFGSETITELDAVFCDRQYEGVEDVKLINYNDQIYFTGTAFKPNNQIGIVGGKYNCENMCDCNVYSIDNEASCEKNWVFLPDVTKMIYKWSPLQIGELVDNKLINLTEKSMPNVFSMARGSTNSFKYNDEIWFVVHIVHQLSNEPRFYYHMFVKFDLDMNLLNYSVPVKFSSDPIEYCCGLIVEDERIIVSHSVWDRESHIKCYDKQYVESFFMPTTTK